MGNTIRTSPTPGKGVCSHQARDYVCMEGDARQARVFTAPGPGDDEADWVAQPVEAEIIITPEGKVTVTSAYLDDASAKSLARDYQNELRDSGLVVLEQGNRYRIGWSYVAIDRIEADRLAKVAKTADIHKDEGVEVTHATDSWALWSDGRITTSIGLPRWLCERKSLSQDAAMLITSCRGSDSGAPQVGWDKLLQVAKIVSKTPEQIGSHGLAHYAPPRIERWEVQLTDGATCPWWVFTEGYPEGYCFEVYDDRQALLAYLAPPKLAAPAYTAKQGQLWEPCERCGAEPVSLPLHLCDRCWPKR